jgi:hypothetical protein
MSMQRGKTPFTNYMLLQKRVRSGPIWIPLLHPVCHEQYRIQSETALFGGGRIAIFDLYESESSNVPLKTGRGKGGVKLLFSIRF